ncbi:MAG: polypeptide deformylase [Gemmatimonadetes bacterium]|nr:polypeptide deformylase [Gemmatimonadota bacterium]
MSRQSLATAVATMALLSPPPAPSEPHRTDPHPDFRLRLMGDPALSTLAARVESPDQLHYALLPSMRTILARTRGLGLAAPQVGVALRVALVWQHDDKAVQRKGERPPRLELLAMLNPRIVNRSPQRLVWSEGCLSVPGFTTSKTRDAIVVVEFLDAATLLPREVKLFGMDAQCAQHELDHLEGRNLTDGLARPLRRRAQRDVADAVAKLAKEPQALGYHPLYRLEGFEP